MSPINSNQSPITSLSKPQFNTRTGDSSVRMGNFSPSPLSFYDRSQSWDVAHNLLTSFRYAGEGVAYAFRTQRNFKIHTLIAIVAIGLSLFLHLSAVKVAIISLTIGAVMAMELLNTAIESIVDLAVGQSYHDLAKIAKDCAAGAVLIFAAAAIFVASILVLPPLFGQIQSWL